MEGVGGARLFLMILDEFTEKWFPVLLRSKAEVAAELSKFKARAEAHFEVNLGEVVVMAGMRSDRERVNDTREIREWCEANGIRHEMSAKYSQWQNGKVERAIGVLWEGGEAMRKDAGAPAKYWPCSLLAFAFVRGLLALGESEQSPHEKWWGIEVPLEKRLGRLRVWGCRAYAHVPSQLRKKGDDKAIECVHLGYSATTKAYLLMKEDTGEMFVSPASVVFDETIMPFKKGGAQDGGDLGVGSWGYGGLGGMVGFFVSLAIGMFPERSLL